MKILQEKDMPLLHRKDYVLELEHEGSTPSKEQVKQKIADLLKHGHDVIVLNHIYEKFGEHRVEIHASVYHDAEKLKHVEERKKKARKDGKEKGKKQKAK